MFKKKKNKNKYNVPIFHVTVPQQIVALRMRIKSFFIGSQTGFIRIMQENFIPAGTHRSLRGGITTGTEELHTPRRTGSQSEVELAHEGRCTYWNRPPAGKGWVGDGGSFPRGICWPGILSSLLTRSGPDWSGDPRGFRASVSLFIIGDDDDDNQITLFD